MRLPRFVALMGLFGAVGLGARAIGPAGQSRPSGPAANYRTAPPLEPLDQAWLRWPLAASEQAYAVIDGQRLITYVREATAISRRSRDRGEPWWGRIQGMPADAETQRWLAAKFRDAGVTDVRTQSFDLPPQWYPSSWSVEASAGGARLRLESAVPAPRSASGTRDVAVAYVGLGTEADFAGRDVNGKAVLINSFPEPGLWSSSALDEGALQRAEQRGAAAIFLAIGLPGNMKMHAVRGAVGIPAFSLGTRDFVAVRQMIERAGQDARVTFSIDARMMPGLTTASVWGVIPGATDEKVIVTAHRDGFFEGAADNASGMATLIGLAEYFSKQPQAQRRRTIMLVGTQGHHGSPDQGIKWIADHKNSDLGGNVALFMNGEHTAAGQTYLLGPAIRQANAANALWWSLQGGVKLQAIVLSAFKKFGVATYAEPQAGGPPGASGDFGDIATVGLVDAGHFYHTDAETDATIPPYGLEASTRAFAKIIDDIQLVDLKALRKASTSQ